MLNKELIAEVARRAKNPVGRTPEAEDVIFARMVAESHRLEGIETTTEAVLDAARSMRPGQRTHATAM